MSEVDRHVEGAAAAHQRLLAMVESTEEPGLSDDMVSRPSLLPGWTVGHVLAHLAHNAESFVRLFVAAEAGEITDQYPGGVEARTADIERDAASPVAVHIDRLRRSLYSLESTWISARRAWEGYGRSLAGDLIPIRDIPLRRWREVEVHTGDLGLDEIGSRGLHTWSEDYVRHDVAFLTMQYKARGSMGLAELPDAVRTAAPRYRLAWLLGRYEVDGAPAPVF